MARRQMLKRLLTNLFDNARKYGLRLGKQAPLLIEIFSPSPHHLSLRLQDHGPGFDSTDQSRSDPAVCAGLERRATPRVPASGLPSWRALWRCTMACWSSAVQSEAVP